MGTIPKINTLENIAFEALTAAYEEATKPPVVEKQCPRCLEIKKLDQFHRNIAAPDGRQSYCKDCHADKRAIKKVNLTPEQKQAQKEYHRAWYLKKRKKDPRYHADQEFRWKLENKEKYLQRRKEKREAGQPLYTPRDRERALKKTYGLTIQGYDEMLSSQEGTCFICKQPPSIHRKLCVDHDHQTGKVRSLLCFKCNLVVGMVETRSEILADLVTYLQRHGIVSTPASAIKGGTAPPRPGGRGIS